MVYPLPMRAMLYRRYGGPEVLELAELPTPEPKAGQVSISVEASSINPIDWKRASGSFKLVMPVKFPSVPGYDLAGTVKALGPGVTSFAVGDRVHARIKESSGGASADVAVAGVDVTTRMPSGMSMEDAAAIPLAGMTAVQALRNKGGLSLEKSSERVLVVGASGGVGHLGVQLARAAGAFVAGVCSTRNVELVKSLGASQVLDYTKPDAYAGLEPFDLVFNAIDDQYAPWMKLLGPKGRFVSTAPTPKLMLRSALNAFTAKKASPMLLNPRAEDLATLDALYAAGKLKVVIDSTHRLEALAEAWKRSQSGRAVGKIVVTHQR